MNGRSDRGLRSNDFRVSGLFRIDDERSLSGVDDERSFDSWDFPDTKPVLAGFPDFFVENFDDRADFDVAFPVLVERDRVESASERESFAGGVVSFARFSSSVFFTSAGVGTAISFSLSVELAATALSGHALFTRIRGEYPRQR